MRGRALQHGSLCLPWPHGGAALHKRTCRNAALASPSLVPRAPPRATTHPPPRPAAPQRPGSLGREGQSGAEPPPGAGRDSPGEAGGRCALAPPWPPSAAPQTGISRYLFLTQHRARALAWPAAASPAARARPARGSAVTRVPAPRGVSPGAARRHGRRASP